MMRRPCIFNPHALTLSLQEKHEYMTVVSISSFTGPYFTSSVPDVSVSVTGDAAQCRVVIACDGDTIYDEVLWPMGDIVRLTDLGSLLEPYAQKQLVTNVVISAQLLSSDGVVVGNVQENTAKVLFSRADVGITAQEFYENYFLTILQGTKITAHGRLEYLWYYGQDAAQVTAEYDDDSTQVFDALVSGGGWAYTQLDVSPGYYEMADRQLIAYTVTAGARSQRFELDLDTPDCAPILEFYNSFGVWELIYCTGTHKVIPSYNRSSARIGGMLRNYRIEETRKFSADTGPLNTAMAAWADDLFRSDEVYVLNVINGEVASADGGKEVVLTDSKSENCNDDDFIPRFTFDYQYAQRIHNVLQMNRVGRIFDNTFDHTFN